MMIAAADLHQPYTPSSNRTPCGDGCACPWWYWYDATRRAWYVARTCGGSRVWVTLPTRATKYDSLLTAETRAELLAHRLNHVYGIKVARVW